jgi:V/A-type H+-transporting ATPase subunit I
LEKRDAVHREWREKQQLRAQKHQIERAQTPSQFFAATSLEKEGKVSYLAYDSFANSFLQELALWLGIAHIFLAFMRQLRAHWAGAGWALFLLGSILFFPSMLNATSMVHFLFGFEKEWAASVGLELVYGGVGAAIVLALLQKRMGGAGEVVNLIQVFSDVLSYLRLYALGLAGSMMSQTFNEIGLSMGVFFGGIVIVIGHIVNITLSIMGGVIHGLRLNFLEWYHHCFEGGGKMWKPFSRRE